MNVVTVDKADEALLFNTMRSGTIGRGIPPVLPITAAAMIGMHDKRAIALVNKWARRGWWGSGVTSNRGWFEPEAPDSLNAKEPPSGGP